MAYLFLKIKECKSRFFLLTLFYLSITIHSQATHIIGGELNYKHLGSYNYEINLSLIRDCSPSSVSFDINAIIGIFNSSNVPLDTLYFPFRGAIRFPDPLAGSCLFNTNIICKEKTNYIDTVNLPPIPGGYQLAYQTCCRNNFIVNVSNSLNTGATYYASIPDTSFAIENSNPTFNNLLPSFVCIHDSIVFDHSATDLDGDSLVYRLFHPYTSNRDSNGEPPHPPPYSGITWRTPYFINNMLGDSSFSINSTTGLISGKMNFLGSFLVGVEVTEFRNGNLLSKTRRDYQINSVYCDETNVAKFENNNFVCGTKTIEFDNKSHGKIDKYIWDFGDLTTISDTSSSFEPTFTYQDTGLYKIRLITVSDNSPHCNDTAYSSVKINPDLEVPINFMNDTCSKKVDLAASSPLDRIFNLRYQWDFGDSSSISFEQNPSHLYKDTGTFNISLISIAHIDNGCIDTSETTIKIFPNLQTEASITPDDCSMKALYIASTNLDDGFNVNYNWDFGINGLSSDTSINQQGEFIYNTVGNFGITLFTSVENTVCRDSFKTQVNILPNFKLTPFFELNNCNNVVSFQSTSSYDSIHKVSYKWLLDDILISNQNEGNHQFSNEGEYNLSLCANTSNGCQDSVNFLLPVLALKEIYVPNVFTPNNDGINDLHFVVGTVLEMELKIYNRWGRVVFESTDQEVGWNGIFKGENLDEGVYFYRLSASCGEETRVELDGNITLIR